MNIQGFAKTSLLDYPGHLAAVVFTPACNFRCPFCHNRDLVLSSVNDCCYTEEYVLDTLKKRKNILEGVCITGGEATLQPDLTDFIKKIRELGYKVKLDSNGYRPSVLRSLIDDGLVDYIAMDIKNSLPKYPLTCGISNFNQENILESISLLKGSTIEYEFRTTVVRELHTEEDLLAIADMLKGCRHYYLQSYKDSENVLADGYSAYSDSEMIALRDAVLPILPSTVLRGIDTERAQS